MNFIYADRKSAWLKELDMLKLDDADYCEDMQSGQGVPYAVDIVKNDDEYSVSVVTHHESLDRLILAGAWFASDYTTEDVEVMEGASIYGLHEYLIGDDGLTEEYVNIFPVGVIHRLADAIMAHAGNPKGVSCDLDSSDLECWTISIGSSAETLDEVADVVMAAEDALCDWLDDAGPGVAKAAYGALTESEQEEVQDVLSKILGEES